MSFDRKKDIGLQPTVLSAETMLGVIGTLGIVPFFENPILGYSIEEMTARANWFDGQEDLRLTPWDWKIPCVQSGDVAYGKFLWGGKAAFATVEWYAELMNWRRSQEKYRPQPDQQRVLDYLAEHGSMCITKWAPGIWQTRNSSGLETLNSQNPLRLSKLSSKFL